MNESLATVIGMTIAYAASLLDLLLAWYGYRKHGRGREEDRRKKGRDGPDLEEARDPREDSKGGTAEGGSSAGSGGSSSAGLLLLAQTAPAERIGEPWMGIVFPAAMLIISFAVTWALYRHFSQLEHED